MKALQAFRGIQLITAVTIAAELVDLKRLDSARQLMAFLGLVPSEHSSGETKRLDRTGEPSTAAWARHRLHARF